MVTRTFSPQRYVFFFVLLNIAFWLISNLLQTESILFNTKSQQISIQIRNDNKNEMIRKLQNTISELKHINDESTYQFIANEHSILSPQTSVVFIADIAGFIGCHIALKLISMNIKVVGFDTLNPTANDMIDISSKFERIKLLKQSHFNYNIIDIIYGNGADHQHLTYIFNQFRITHILHLMPCHHGAKLTMSHFELCTQSLMVFLDAMMDAYPHHYKNIPFIYGVDDEINANTNSFIHIVNSNLAKSYHLSYDIRMTVLRFYSVYGPYHYTFMLHMSGTVYISDVVDGVVSALNHGYKYAVFDLAKRQSNISHNISLATQYLQYAPAIAFHTGMKYFRDWYHNDFHDRAQYVKNKKRFLVLNCFLNPRKVPELSNYWNKYKQSKNLQNIGAVHGFYSSLQEAVSDKRDLQYLTDIVIFDNDVSWKQQIENPEYNDIMFISIDFDYRYKHFRAYNDARFIWWYQYLKRYKQYYQYVLITDLFDVKFGSDPLQYITRRIGNDMKSVISGTQNKATKANDFKDYLFKVMRRCYFGVSVWRGTDIAEEQYLLNPGSGIAAHSATMLTILQRMVEYEMPYSDAMCDANMMQYAKTMNYLAINGTINILNTTADWNSVFNAHQNYTDRRYVIYHK